MRKKYRSRFAMWVKKLDLLISLKLSGRIQTASFILYNEYGWKFHTAVITPKAVHPKLMCNACLSKKSKLEGVMVMIRACPLE